LAEYRDITIQNVTVTGARRIFSASGLPEKYLSSMTWENITAEGEEAGFIEYARDWTMENVTIRTPAGEAVRSTNNENVELPVPVQ
ncbi:MAG TPA: hypothetical protein VNZ57_00435, partial [Longimicrobiales bacterium]|nr:hypothetical protein [Longimicrobiales bacterium]